MWGASQFHRRPRSRRAAGVPLIRSRCAPAPTGRSSESKITAGDPRHPEVGSEAASAWRLVLPRLSGRGFLLRHPKSRDTAGGMEAQNVEIVGAGLEAFNRTHQPVMETLHPDTAEDLPDFGALIVLTASRSSPLSGLGHSKTLDPVFDEIRTGPEPRASKPPGCGGRPRVIRSRRWRPGPVLQPSPAARARWRARPPSS